MTKLARGHSNCHAFQQTVHGNFTTEFCGTTTNAQSIWSCFQQHTCGSLFCHSRQRLAQSSVPFPKSSAALTILCANIRCAYFSLRNSSGRQDGVEVRVLLLQVNVHEVHVRQPLNHLHAHARQPLLGPTAFLASSFEAFEPKKVEMLCLPFR